MEDKQVIRDTYLSFDEIFNTKKTKILCPDKITIRVVRGFIDLCIPKTVELSLNKSELKDGDIVMVGSMNYPDRYYCNGCFIKLAAKPMKIKIDEHGNILNSKGEKNE